MNCACTNLWKNSGMRSRCAFVVLGAVAFAQTLDQMLADLTELIERKPDFAAAYYARGITHLQAKQYWLAGLDLSKTIELTPGDASVYVGRADLYSATRQWDAAIADLTTAIGLKPRPTFYLRRAESYRSKGDCAHAVADYSAALAEWETLEAALHGRAECRKQLGDAAGAAEDQRQIDKIAELTARVNATSAAPAVPAGPASSGSGAKVPSPAPYSPPNVYRIGGGVSQPLLLFQVQPEYSEEARKAKWQGKVSLSIVVDEFGQPQNLTVVRGLGLGLDEEAIDAVHRWVFKPARKDGNPVAVYANVEVTFHLL